MPQGLLLSNSVLTGSGYLEWCRPILEKFFSKNKNLLFIPYAAVSYSFDQYEKNVKKALLSCSGKITSIHRIKEKEKEKAVKDCDGFIVGGGNTFALKKRLEDDKIFFSIKKRIQKENISYAGWSAGANIGSLSIKTTNDMPIIQPESFDGFGVVDFQLNPHYTDIKIPNHNGETRDERLIEFSVLNPCIYCIAIPEGSGISVEKSGGKKYFGEKKAKLFHNGKCCKDIENGEYLSFQ